eukprot:6928987-Pyramimonas_sp.AAC.2
MPVNMSNASTGTDRERRGFQRSTPTAVVAEKHVHARATSRSSRGAPRGKPSPASATRSNQRSNT